MAIQRKGRAMPKAAAYLLMLLLGACGLAHAGTVTYVYTDPQGTPLAEADASGNITATFDYAPYGSQALGTAPNGPGYTGHVNDPDTGFVYMQARYYDPQVGRFISTDPIGPAAANPFNFNRYDYASDNPSRYTDPDGRMIWDDSHRQSDQSGCRYTPAACEMALDTKSKPKQSVVAQAAAAAADAFNSVVAAPEFVQSSEGIGDSLSLGATKGVRQLSGIGDPSPNSSAYKVGYYGSMVPGVARLAYTMGAEGASAVGSVIGGEQGARVANAGRNGFRIMFRGFTSGYHAYPFSRVAAKYGYNWDAVISASGRTNPQFNAMGVAGGAASAANQAGQCVVGQSGC